jgi:hypothetical protein
MPVNTARVAGRRILDYASFDELLADAERLSTEPVKVLGNWSPGQIFRHIAILCNGSIDGLPIRFPWHLRAMVRLFKKKLLQGSMPAGFQIKSPNDKVLLPGPTSVEEGLSELRASIARVQRESQRARHPLFGNLTKEEWDRVNLKHASLHMSFLIPE